MKLDSYASMLPLRALAALLPRRVALSLAVHPFARYLVDFMYLPRWRPEWVRIDGELPPPPFVLAGGHVGHWEMAGAAIASRVPLTVLVRDHDDARLLAFRERTRARFGIETVVDRLPPLLAALRRGRAVAMLVDRHARGPHAAATLARRAGCPLITGTVVPEGERYRVVIEPPCDEAGLRDRLARYCRGPYFFQRPTQSAVRFR